MAHEFLFLQTTTEAATLPISPWTEMYFSLSVYPAPDLPLRGESYYLSGYLYDYLLFHFGEMKLLPPHGTGTNEIFLHSTLR